MGKEYIWTMTNNNDLIDLYSKRILALAADIERTKRLDNPQSNRKKTISYVWINGDSRYMSK